MEVQKWELRWRFYWWKADFKMGLIKTMGKRWPTSDFKLFISNINSLKSDFDPTPCNEDSESYFSDIMKIGDSLRKNKNRQKRLKKNLSNCKTYSFMIMFHFWVSFNFSLTDATNYF